MLIKDPDISRMRLIMGIDGGCECLLGMYGLVGWLGGVYGCVRVYG